MKPIDIPVVGIGPGSQPDDGDQLEFIEMPRGMFRHEIFTLPNPEQFTTLSVARKVLNDINMAVQDYRCGEPAMRIDLNHLSLRDCDMLGQILGEGEVSITVTHDDGTVNQIQESILTGIWRVQTLDDKQRLLDDCLEVADIPAVVRTESFRGDRHIDCSLEALPEGVQNAPPLLVEIADRLPEAEDDTDNTHVINLSLLPLTAEDLILLGERLGVGPTTILSRGYGNCRIGATAKDGVWWIKYFNSQDVLILNTIEITMIPEIALAAPEDIEASRERMHEITELYV